MYCLYLSINLRCWFSYNEQLFVWKQAEAGMVSTQVKWLVAYFIFTSIYSEISGAGNEGQKKKIKKNWDKKKIKSNQPSDQNIYWFGSVFSLCFEMRPS